MTMVGESVGTRRVATYERVSSEDQRERETIRTQTEVLARSLDGDPDVVLVERYVDDGVSGMVPLAERPAGARLMRDAAAGRFSELHVYKLDRLGRDEIDLLSARRRLEELGVRLRSVTEGEHDLTGYGFQAIMAGHYRREFLRRSADGMDRAAREGRYVGGICPYGYRVEGEKGAGRLVPDEAEVCPGWTAAAVVRWIYERIGIDDWSGKRIADGLNAMGVPTGYAKEGRGVRGQRTRGVWRSGRIVNLVKEPIYRGEQVFGRRSKKPRETISASVPALVSTELWQAARDAFARHRICAKNADRIYLLVGTVVCANCGLRYSGSAGRDGSVWYRCGGKNPERGAVDGTCHGKMIKGDLLEPVVWQDIERFLRDPGDILAELDDPDERDAAAARHARELQRIEAGQTALEEQRANALRLAVRGTMSDDVLDAELARIGAEKAALEGQRASLATTPIQEAPVEADLLGRLRSRLEAGLTDAERHEIVRLLVGRITITTIINADGSKDAKATIAYRFNAVAATRTGIRASLEYTRLQREVRLPPSGRWPRKAAA